MRNKGVKLLYSLRIAASVAAAWMVCIVSLAGTDDQGEAVREQLRNRIEAAGLPARLTVGDERIYAALALPQFYERRAFQPAWTAGGLAAPQAFELLEAIRLAGKEGLVASNYHLAAIEMHLGSNSGASQAVSALGVRTSVDLELLLTDAFLLYGSHLLAGQVNPETFDSEWFANRRSMDMAAVLQQALDAGRVGFALDSLKPRHPGYKRLHEALARYRELSVAGGWPTIPGGAKIEAGGRDERVAFLRRRLLLEGDLADSTPAADPDLLDPLLVSALRLFQSRHGLEPDGIAGPATLKALNVHVEERVGQIRLNLERWRWLPEDLGRRYVLVNIADFKLEVVEDGRPILEMKAIVGKSYRRSPVFSGKISYLVLNPYWHVPQKIAVADKLPLIQKEPPLPGRAELQAFRGVGRRPVRSTPPVSTGAGSRPGIFPTACARTRGPKTPWVRSSSCFPTVSASTCTTPPRGSCLTRLRDPSARVVSALKSRWRWPSTC